MNTINEILIIDDHPVLLEGIKSVISKSNLKTGSITTCTSALEALNILMSKNIEIVITDISMPEMNGLEFSKICKKKYPNIKIVILSQFEDIQIIKPLVKIDVNAIILKGQQTDEIILALECVLNNEKYYSNQIKELIFNDLINIPSDNKLIKLSKREQQVLELLADEKTSKEISEILFISVPTIETYRSNLFKKFEVKNLAGLIRKSMQLGFIE
ncbi:MAG: response regulator transcription factor [Bacteroidales bacterium]|nr:response regulator transcription factor [Bacteroidales bacterium]